MILIDRIVAVIISSIIVLMGFSVQQRATQTSVGNAMLYVGKKQTLELADLLERDLANVGFDISPDQDAITEFIPGQENLERLQFFGSDATGNQIEIRYDLVAVDTVEIGQEQVPLYELQRFENSGTAWVSAGGSPSTLTRFYVDLLSETNLSVGKADARRVRVWLENAVMPEASQGQMMESLRRLRWSVTIAPSNLRDYQGG